MFHHLSDTIAALATPVGTSALGIVRVSGVDAISKVNSIFEGANIEKAESHTIHYGFIKVNGKTIDEVMVSIMRAPRSFTTEDSVEINCHGSPFIIQRVLESLLQIGIRLAKPGEFTQRAFLNGRIDLPQAEAVADLIATENESQHRLAIDQMRGGYAKDLSELRIELIDFTALVELELDFPEEDVEFAKRDTMLELIDKISNFIQSLISSFKYGNVLKNGVLTVIAGRPNAGKSTLLNALLNDERAIVSAIPGTTRDTIEEQLVVDGINFRLVDTAGIREATDEIERIGIEKTMFSAKKASVLLYIFDGSTMDLAEVLTDLDEIKSDKGETIIVLNKIDQLVGDDILNWKNSLAGRGEVVTISAHEKTYLDTLLKRMVSTVFEKGIETDSSSILSNTRHFESLQLALNTLIKSREGLVNCLGGEMLSHDLREALYHMGSITGEVSNEDILGSIFSRFCIGK